MIISHDSWLLYSLIFCCSSCSVLIMMPTQTWVFSFSVSQSLSSSSLQSNRTIAFPVHFPLLQPFPRQTFTLQPLLVSLLSLPFPGATSSSAGHSVSVSCCWCCCSKREEKLSFQDNFLTNSCNHGRHHLLKYIDSWANPTLFDDVTSIFYSTWLSFFCKKERIESVNTCSPLIPPPHPLLHLYLCCWNGSRQEMFSPIDRSIFLVLFLCYCSTKQSWLTQVHPRPGSNIRFLYQRYTRICMMYVGC